MNPLVFILIILLLNLASASDSAIPGLKFLQDPLYIAFQAAPFWFFSQSLNRNPCYPSLAALNGIPNPGTPVPIVPEPGKGCPNPGPLKGAYSPGNPFPTYFTVRFCPRDQSWRVVYSLYFSHEGMGALGRRHDWEWVAVIWKKCPRAERQEKDLWCKSRLVRSINNKAEKQDWGSVHDTVNGADEVRNQGDRGKNHPLIYVGAFKHAMFDTRKTWLNVIGRDEDEFRNNDWFYWAANSLVPGETIERAWDYGEAKSTPGWVYDRVCEEVYD